MVTIVDYGMGNLRSVQKAFESLGARATVTASPAAVRRARRLVLPGVGAFGDAMRELRRRRLVQPLLERIRAGVPFLGVCLGLQLLFETSEESPGARGLGVLAGRVRKIPRHPATLKVPHIGWNQLEPSPKTDCRFLRGVKRGDFVYFVHSYYAEPVDRAVIAAQTTYGRTFPSVVCAGNVAATQFHPEKSQRVGLTILRNYLDAAC
ncbi:MAG: imidazole glycerol phosphate synthase subunit HisH [Candidatus Omnitrophica bacterium]|nr:imidazole glycerol phosphate synthase subunit HisH [Candidatus Omnitrophota bacterium]